MSNANTAANLFDFANLDDLPEELRKPLETQSLDNAKAYAQIVIDGAAAGHEALTLRQIHAVAFRKFGTVPKPATVRNYLNEAIAHKLIGKPSRNTYGADASVVVVGEDDDDVAQVGAAAEAGAVDPLAGL